MKKIILILFAFVCFIGNVEIGLGQTFQWDSTQSIIYTTDSTAKIPSSVGTDTIYMIDVLPEDSGNNYINRRSPVKMIYDFNQDAADDTIYAATIFQNYNYDSLFYVKISAAVEGLPILYKPERITDIEVYSTATDRMSYFDVPTQGTITVKKTGGDYSTIQSALNASISTDVIDVYEGVYEENWSGTYALYSNNKTAKIRCVGDVVIKKQTQTYTIGFINGKVDLENAQIDGNKTGINVFSAVGGQTLSNCAIINSGSNTLRVDNSTIDNCYIDASSSNSNIFINNDGARFINSYIKFADQVSGIRPNTLKTGGITMKYCDIDGNEPTTIININNNGNDTLMYNKITSKLIRNFISYVDTGLTGTKIIKGNYFAPDSVILTDGAFVRLIDHHQMNVFSSENNIIIDSGICSGYIFQNLDSISVTYDSIDIKYNQYGINIIRPHGGAYIANNYIVGRYSRNTGEGFYIRITADTHRNNTYFLIENNEIFSPNFFDESRIGIHACIFSSAKNQDIRYNYLNGSNDVGNIVLKGLEINKYNTSIYGNILINGAALIKGYPFIKYYNNMHYNSPKYALKIIDDLDIPGKYSYSTDLIIQNNIFYSDISDGVLIDVTGDSSLQRLTMDYNILFGDTIIKYDNNSYYTFSEWQGQGYDVNSFDTDPNLKSSTELWPIQPSDAIGNGLDLGAPYDQGLSTSSTWPDNVITTPQLSSWSIGAYIVDIEEVLEENSEIDIKKTRAIYIDNRKHIIILR